MHRCKLIEGRLRSQAISIIEAELLKGGGDDLANLINFTLVGGTEVPITKPQVHGILVNGSVAELPGCQYERATANSPLDAQHCKHDWRRCISR